VLGRLEKGHGRDRPFSPGGVAYRPRHSAGAGRSVQAGSDGYGLVALYEAFAAEYGWTADYIDAHLTDEQFALYAEKASQRKTQEALAELDRIVAGTSWGVSIAFDTKGKSARKWKSIQRKALPGSQPKGLSGKELDDAVLALAAADPSLVKFVQAGAS
jgi:hypothetical protein